MDGRIFQTIADHYYSMTLQEHRRPVSQSLADLHAVLDSIDQSRAWKDGRLRSERSGLVVNRQDRDPSDREGGGKRLVRMSDGVDIGASVIDRGVDHRLARRRSQLCHLSLPARLGPVLLADGLVFIDIHNDDVLAGDRSQGA